MPEDKPKFSVIIPVYNSEACLAELQKRLNASLDAFCSNWEILYVEDCGGDDSMKYLKILPIRMSE